MAACEFFLKNERASRSYLQALLDLDPLFVMDSQKFPPPIVSLFSEVQTQPRFPKRRITFRTSGTDLSARFLGQRVSVERASDEIWNLFLPVGHPFLGSQSIVVEARDSAPLKIEISKFPPELKFESTLDQQYSSLGLYGVLNNSTPSPRLLEVSRAVGAQIVFLGDFIQDLQGGWQAKAQWLDLNSLETSKVLTQEGGDLQAATSLLMARMIGLLNPQGIRPEALLRNQVLVSEQPTFEKQAYYKTWWFWTIVGVAAVGAGVGGYFLFSPDEKLNFRVREAQ